MDDFRDAIGTDTAAGAGHVELDRLQQSQSPNANAVSQLESVQFNALAANYHQHHHSPHAHHGHHHPSHTKSPAALLGLTPN